MGTKKINLVVVTGMSGAGKTVAIQSFEDIIDGTYEAPLFGT